MTDREAAQCNVDAWADSVLEEIDVFQQLANSLPRKPESDVYQVNFWYDGGEDILCKTKDLADALADWLDRHGYWNPAVGYYDPKDWGTEYLTYECGGWYYVHL